MSLIIGRHLAEVTAPSNGWFAEAGKNNTPFIRIPIRFLEAPMKGQCEIYQAWISDSAYERTIKNLREVFPDWDGDLESLAQQISDGPFVGKKVSIVCEEEPDQNGDPKVRIKWLNGPDGGGKIMQANAALQLARRLSGKPPGDDIPTGAPVERRAQPPRPQADPDPLGTDEPDIPFN